jgi:hypothetical protein
VRLAKARSADGTVGRTKEPGGRRRPPERQIPDLNPDYFEEVQRSIEAHGGRESLDEVARGIANAIANVSHQLFEAGASPGEPRVLTSALTLMSATAAGWRLQTKWSTG